MTSAAIIKEIEQLPPAEQAEVIRYTLGLIRSRQLSGKELGELADKLTTSADPAEIMQLQATMTRGFYGE